MQVVGFTMPREGNKKARQARARNNKESAVYIDARARRPHKKPRAARRVVKRKEKQAAIAA